MGADRTERLAIIVDAKDLAKGKLAGTKRELAGLKTASVGASGGVGRLTGKVNALGGAFGRAKSKLGGLLSGPLGLIGLGAGIFGVGRFMTGAIDKAKEFGDVTVRVAKVTGMAVEATSRQVDVLDKFGITGENQVKMFGLLEKNVGKYGATTKTATKFQKAYGFSLTDNKGKVVDANELLKRSADYFNSNATAGQKATVMSKLWGKSWQTLIPLLTKGRAGINKEEQTALSLNKQELKDLAALRGAQRELNDTWGDTQVKVGLVLIPMLTKLSRVANSFLSKNSAGITKFFKDGYAFASEMADVIRGPVLSAIGAIGGAWNSIPGDFRKMLLTGLVANKALKMTIGFDPIDMVRKGITGAIGGLIGRGSSPATPMYTKEVGLGAAGGAGALGGASKGGKILGALGIVGAIAGPVVAAIEISNDNSAAAKAINIEQVKWLRTQPSRADLQRGLSAIDTGIAQIRSNPLHVLVQGEALARLEKMHAAQVAALAKLDAIAAAKGTINYINNERAQNPVIGPKRRQPGQPSPYQNQPGANQPIRRNAAGLLGLTKGATDVGVAGEAGKEAVAIIKKPKAIKGKTGLPVFVTNWPSGAGGGASVDDVTGEKKPKWKLTKVRRGSARANGLLREAVNVVVRVPPAKHSARESDRADRVWRRHGNGSAVTID